MTQHAQETSGCPDEATCHHRCMIGCWRVANAEPLSSAGMPRNQWPSSIRREFGTVVQAGASTISGAFDAAVAAMDASSDDDADPPATNLVTDSAPASESGEVPLPEPDPVEVLPAPPLITPPEPPELRMVGPDGEGIPIIDLHAQLQNLDQTVVALRAYAKVMAAYANQATRWADGLAHLRSTLNGET